MKSEYIVTINKDVSRENFLKLMEKYGITMKVDYNALVRMFHVEMDSEHKASLKAEPEVYHVAPAEAEVNLLVSVKMAKPKVDIERPSNLIDTSATAASINQDINVNAYGYGGNWGLTRICKRDNWNDSTWYPNSGTYISYHDGDGTDIYIVDTGANITHNDFTGRIEVIYDHYKRKSDSAYGIDVMGHGTHVASTAAGTTYGVAKKAKIYVSRVFESGGATLVAILSGINAALAHHIGKKNNNINRPSIMNLSLGGPAHYTEEQVINDCIEHGVVVVAAAGNDGRDLGEAGYDVMPAEIARAVTVGATDIQDRVAIFSNYGAMVDVFAPGMYITAASHSTSIGESMLSGTSMASPHVAGICALKAQGLNIGRNANDVALIHDWIANNATQNTITMLTETINAGTANKLVFSDFLEPSDSLDTDLVAEEEARRAAEQAAAEEAARKAAEEEAARQAEEEAARKAAEEEAARKAAEEEAVRQAEEAARKAAEEAARQAEEEAARKAAEEEEARRKAEEEARLIEEEKARKAAEEEAARQAEEEAARQAEEEARKAAEEEALRKAAEEAARKAAEEEAARQAEEERIRKEEEAREAQRSADEAAARATREAEEAARKAAEERAKEEAEKEEPVKEEPVKEEPKKDPPSKGKRKWDKVTGRHASSLRHIFEKYEEKYGEKYPDGHAECDAILDELHALFEEYDESHGRQRGRLFRSIRKLRRRLSRILG